LITQTPTRKFLSGWGDADMNGHMRGTAYLNKAIDARVSILGEMGFPREEFTRLRLGVVGMKDEIEYRREVRWMEEIAITVLIRAGPANLGRSVSGFSA
jgi:acyl-CoA thioester hydrolase